MAYNKITSHFSSSHGFSEDRFFVYDNSNNKSNLVHFIDNSESSGIQVTGSSDNIFITGVLDLKNNVTSSKAIFSDSTKNLKIKDDSVYFVKKKDNSISLNTGTNIGLTGSIASSQALINNGITGSLIETDDSGTKLINNLSGLNVNIETEATSNRRRWVLSQATQDSSFAQITNFLIRKTSSSANNVKENSLIHTGSSTIEHYNDSLSNSPFTEIASNVFKLEFYKLTDEHIDSMTKGKIHIIIIQTDTSYVFGLKIFPSFSNDSFSSNQIGAKYLFIIGDYLSSKMHNKTIEIVLPSGSTFTDNNQSSRIAVVGNNNCGVSFTLKCVDTNKWQFDDDN